MSMHIFLCTCIFLNLCNFFLTIKSDDTMESSSPLYVKSRFPSDLPAQSYDYVISYICSKDCCEFL